MTDSDRPVRPEFVDDGAPAPLPRSSGIAYLQLFRAPNVFTAIADVAMGYLVTTRSLEHWPDFAWLVGASMVVYTAGMVLNDVFDIEIDRVERPSRPIPSGRIPWERARWLGLLMLAAGVLCGWLAGFTSSTAVGPTWRSGAVVTALAGAVLLYDGWAKKTLLGLVVMGSCRALNVLLGMSLNAAVVTQEPQWLGFGTSHVSIAAGIGLYIVGVTCFARSEATVSPRAMLVLGLLIMASGIALLALFPRWHPGSFEYRYEPKSTWPFAVAAMSIWILRRCLVAIRDPSPDQVHVTVKHCILSLILLDAMVCILMCDWPYGVGIVALLLPTMLLGRWVYST